MKRFCNKMLLMNCAAHYVPTCATRSCTSTDPSVSRPVDHNAVASTLSFSDAEKIYALKRADALKLPPAELTPQQWCSLFARTAIPFFAFGLCDNIIMITVGDLIDEQFGVVMGFSTMIAAGLGQAVSDGSGVTIQQVIEEQVDERNFCDPHLTLQQANSKRILFLQQVFRTVGIILGCLVALIPVILLDTGNKVRLYDMLLKGLPEEKRRELSAKGFYVTFDPKETIIKYGRPPEGCYTIVSGEVQVIGRSESGEEVELCIHGPGNCIGILELVFGHNSVADVVAVGHVKALKIQPSDFEEIMSDDLKKTVTEFIKQDPTFVPYCLRYLQ